ncbi:MAG: M24 family metallopeptidase [Terriglobales bacterium]
MSDPERVQRIRDVLKADNLDAVVCALHAYVLMLSGYCPVIGTSLCVATSDGARILLVPADEKELAGQGHADEVRTYQPVSLDTLPSVLDAATAPLKQLLHDHGLHCSRVGYEFGPAAEPASYAGMNLFCGSIAELLHRVSPGAALAPADEDLQRLAAVKTPAEIERIRRTCEIVAEAFERGRAQLRIGMAETAAAELFRVPLYVQGTAHDNVRQGAGGMAWCMSGKNSAKASAAYARSRDAVIARHEFVLVHCNGQADGYWTDVTRTYVLGSPQERQVKLYEAVFSARAAALAAIRPGARACDVDRAVRDVLRSRGLDHAMPHPTGHGVGFAAVAATARPRIHPKSEETLEAGMVFNVEPAVYFDSYGGLRHCDMVAVTSSGVDVLTPFQSSTDELILSERREAA